MSHRRSWAGRPRVETVAITGAAINTNTVSGDAAYSAASTNPTPALSRWVLTCGLPIIASMSARCGSVYLAIGSRREATDRYS